MRHEKQEHQTRLVEASEALRDAKLLLKHERFRASVNRSYYTMFYAVLGLLASRHLCTSKHSGAIALFDKEFVKAGAFDKTLSVMLHKAFEKRQESDYEEMTDVPRVDAQELTANAAVFLKSVRAHLRGQ